MVGPPMSPPAVHVASWKDEKIGTVSRSESVRAVEDAVSSVSVNWSERVIYR